ncbi:MAG: DoxX family protein [Gloeobacteraceae cyanobacterium ES-bin-144]|nr:DoxX family protein [Verrucomicrobiales bacterium]
MNMRNIARMVLSVSFIVAGLNHFRSPEVYIAMMPLWLPARESLNLISGAMEILGAIGLLIPVTRRAAAVGLILLIIAVFPANIQVAVNGWPGMDIPQWMLWARLPFQLLFIAWVVYACPGLRYMPIPKQDERALASWKKSDTISHVS